MHEPTEFKAILWHPKDGVREVSVHLAPGPLPFSSDPSKVGVHYVIRDPKDSGSNLAVLFMETDEALRLAKGELHTSARLAENMNTILSERLR